MNEAGAKMLLNMQATISIMSLVLHPEGASETIKAVEEEIAWQIEKANAARRNIMMRETVLCLWGDQ